MILIVLLALLGGGGWFAYQKFGKGKGSGAVASSDVAAKDYEGFAFA